MSYSLFYQDSSSWSKWASCANVSNDLNRPDLVAFDGVAQIFAHFSQVALRSGYTDVVPLPFLSRATVPSGVPGAYGAPCIIGATFSNTNGKSGLGSSNGDSRGSNGATIAVLNVCPSEEASFKNPHYPPPASRTPARTPAPFMLRQLCGARTMPMTSCNMQAITLPAAMTMGATEVTATTYTGFDKGGFVLADQIGSLESPPWQRGLCSKTPLSNQESARGH